MEPHTSLVQLGKLHHLGREELQSVVGYRGGELSLRSGHQASVVTELQGRAYPEYSQGQCPAGDQMRTQPAQVAPVSRSHGLQDLEPVPQHVLEGHLQGRENTSFNLNTFLEYSNNTTAQDVSLPDGSSSVHRISGRGKRSKGCTPFPAMQVQHYYAGKEQQWLKEL